ncbi:MAG TPA: class I SAM-dependent methyltransferase [Rhodocyclaceae bacterium]|nr:class I SAM-dependent methyltransferase [Rhodocyclaceae bacterium]
MQDVPSPIDLRNMHDAREWAQAAPRRPGRQDFLDLFVAKIAETRRPGTRVLELGSGPGFLAHQVLSVMPNLEYVALDFSAAMHDLASERLGSLATWVSFVERSFKDADWAAGLGRFDWVITNQAVHELRHKRHTAALHSQVREILAADGSYLVCDHFCGTGGLTNDQLYMTPEEQAQALRDGGFGDVAMLLQRGSLVMHRANAASGLLTMEH